MSDHLGRRSITVLGEERQWPVPQVEYFYVERGMISGSGHNPADDSIGSASRPGASDDDL
jgi:hypothetical protein